MIFTMQQRPQTHAIMKVAVLVGGGGGVIKYTVRLLHATKMYEDGMRGGHLRTYHQGNFHN